MFSPRNILRRVALPLLTLWIAFPVCVSAQVAGKRPLDHTDYDRWNRITNPALSSDGAWVTYTLTPREGDPTVVLRSVATDREIRFERGSGPSFSRGGTHLVFRIRPATAVTDSLEEADVDSDDMPGDTLAILALSSVMDGGAPQLERIPETQGSALPPDANGWIAIQMDRPDSPDDEDSEDASSGGGAPAGRGGRGGGRGGRGGGGGGGGGDGNLGADLVIRSLDGDVTNTLADVASYRWTEDGTRIIVTHRSTDEDGLHGIRVIDPTTGDGPFLLSGKGQYRNMTFDEDQEQIAVLFSADPPEPEEGAEEQDDEDEDAEEPDREWGLWIGALDGASAQERANDASQGIPDGWELTPGTLDFSENGERLFFEIRPTPEPEPEPLPEDEQVEVDIWNWQDPFLQPMQLVQAERERNRTYTALMDLSDGSILPFEDPSLQNVSPTQDGDGSLGLAMNDIPYRQLVSWDGRYNDVYLVDMETGDREMVAEMIRGGASVSPEGRYLYWWDGVLRNWLAMDTETHETTNITESMTVDVYDRRDDRPQPPGSWGSAGWTEGDAGFVIYDEFDIWKVDPSGRTAAVNLTEGVGRREGIRFHYSGTGEADGPDYIPEDRDVYLTAFNVRTKADGFYRDRFASSAEPIELLMGDYSYSNPTRAEDAREVLMFTRQSFAEFPDLWITDPDFSSMRKISNANPQQEEYVWGTGEIVEWNSTDAEPLQGILYKPEGFDPSQEYPMMVYFYELSSDGLHSYKTPSPGTSINYSFYVSRGYLLFVPDITYETGYPGESAMDAVIPGILSLIAEGYVDRDAIGVQGHSWGGYQIAYMITKTDIFAAAEAGAPVSNMTSAYGGIRWDSGMSRAFQYEQTQSRIGGTLWESTSRYIENSPLFFVDKIDTPLLILHNDQDGAVPWYQGIELFSAMRRLQKPVWMLNYNGERHGLSKPANQKDWAIRMQQFFDHYLQGAPPAVWMIEGVPATEKGRNLGLRLITRVISAEGAEPGR